MKNRPFDDDMEIVEGCVKKDLKAWASLIEKYSNLISASIENRLKKYGYSLPCQDIEDIRQNVLASIWKDNKLESVRNRRNISYWLAIVSGNMAMLYVRSTLRKEPVKPVSIFDKIDETELLELIPSTELNPSDELAKNEISKKIAKEIDSLPPKEKFIIKLHLLYDKKYDEISGILNLPEGTVSSYIKRAKEKLRKRLKEFR